MKTYTLCVHAFVRTENGYGTHILEVNHCPHPFITSEIVNQITERVKKNETGSWVYERPIHIYSAIEEEK